MKRRVIVIMVVGGILLVSMVVGSAVAIKRAARGRIYDSVESMPKRKAFTWSLHPFCSPVTT
jgi:hypothetical protein